MNGKPWAWAAPALMALALASGAAAAQERLDSAVAPAPPRTLTLNAGARSEQYLRHQQALGETPLSQWAIRPLGPRERDALVARAGTPVRDFERPVRDAGRMLWQVIPLAADAWYNSGFAFGENDGPVWRGRGLTLAARGGVAMRYGALWVQLEPVAFIAQNRAFALMPLASGVVAPIYADPLEPTRIDRPQRFGDGRYARVDLGESTIRVDAFGVAAGLSTASQWWGPMSEWPYLLGNNAGGFPHLFAGSAAPVDVGIGQVHGRLFYGRLDQTDYTTITGSASRQFASGIILAYQPRGLTGLEVGVARMFELAWPEGGIGWRELRKPIEPFLKINVTGDPGAPDNNSADNQLASVFARWVLPRSGFEVYGELGRNDHNRDTRDLLGEPDHSLTVGVGARKAWRRADGEISAVRAEALDMGIPTLARHRGEGGFYTHSRSRQGHTQRGQVLGAGFAAVSGAGHRLAWERHQPAGERLAVTASRLVVRERPQRDSLSEPVDVQYTLGAHRTVRYRGLGLTYGATVVRELNRYFAGDASNVEIAAGVSW